MPELVDTIIEDARWDSVAIATLAETACGAVLASLDLDPAQFEISLLACGDGRIAGLNSNFRDKSAPTNVLSWPDTDLAAQNDGGFPDLPCGAELGDIAISYDTCAAEATSQHKPFADHVTHLLVHGCLHLLGYDHVSDKDAALMEGFEVAILAKLGIADPY